MIVAACPGDWPALLELWVAAWKATPIKVDFDARRAWFRAHLQTLTQAGYLAAMAPGPQGFVVLHPASGHIDQLAVAPAVRGSGIAAALIAHAKALAPQGLHLDVNQDNPRAVRFYQREGFVIAGERVSAVSGLKLFDMAWRPS